MVETSYLICGSDPYNKETLHYNTTNQCNHYVTELFEIKIDHTPQKLKSIKKNHHNRLSGL